jgi:uncharacterized YigZ family protein
LLEHVSFEGEKIKGSRFIVNIYPIKKMDESKEVLDVIQKKYPGARHHCYALRTSNGEARSSDAGEPRGSGGAPILRRIESRDAVDLIVVVTRYFGGTKLGIGGLVRAYGGAAAKALEEAEFVEIVERVAISFAYAYSDSGPVQGVVKNIPDASIEYGERITATILLPVGDVDSFKKELSERTSGRVEWIDNN